MSNLLVIDMQVATAQARHSGYFGAWEGKCNPHKVGSRLWQEWNAGRRAAASVAPVQESEPQASLVPMPVTDWE